MILQSTEALRPALAGTAAAALVLTGCGLTDQEPPPAEEAEETQPGEHLDPEDVPEADPDEEDTDAGEPYLSQQAVSAGHPEAVAAAEEILAQGGNAVDAAVAASFAVAVIEPVASGIGGGGSAILAGPEGEPVFYDYREVVNNDGDIPDTGTGIPGFVAGMGQLHEEYGQLSWEEVLEPSRVLADEGFEVSDYLAERITTGQGPEYLAELEAFTPDGASLQAGDDLVQPELAETMERLIDAGWEDYYTGELAASLVEQAEGIDAESLESYEVITSEPVTGEVGDYDVVSASPSLPGPALIQMLQIAEAEGIAEMEPGSAEYIDTLSRAWGVAEETIFTDLGDPNFVEVPVDEITDPAANAELEVPGPAAASAPLNSTDRDTAQLSAGEEPAHANTTHIVVVDEDGLTVSMTNTITDFWGSGQAVDGYFLNNALDRFEHIDSPANQPEPGRRTVTWSNPTMVLDADGRPVLGVGTPGGQQILNIIADIIIQWGLQDIPLEEAVTSLRFRGEGEALYLEEGHPDEVIGQLQETGWDTELWPSSTYGSAQVLQIDYEAEQITGADDPRRDGAHAILE
ncbi:gamma-glutamyltransferase [Nesterenkonia alba]|uniref:gamma-glutamyltransferase n=1 Tax=Nesterenkonia alba TaxID=515814 RepID=UPI0003B529BD|nr:gamma-glutamyltransferase [Nesterenkonia alba]